MSNNGNFTISLDFELYWGMRDLVSLKNYSENIRNVQVVIPRILSLFQKYEIHATWAIVGFLFAKDKEQLLEMMPARLPAYSRMEYSPYEYIKENDLQNEYHFAPQSIALIQNTPHQEVATHTFSHYYVLENGQDDEQFKSDLECAVAAHPSPLESIVFPRNQYDDKSLRVAQSVGIRYYRGNPSFSFYKPRPFDSENIFIRMLRIADAYVNITGQNTFKVEANSDGLVNIPASKFLRPYKRSLKFIENLRFRRISNAMAYAARNKENYHLWWHPHNFGKNMEENLSFLERILMQFQSLKSQHGFQSKSMNEY